MFEAILLQNCLGLIFAGKEILIPWSKPRDGFFVVALYSTARTHFSKKLNSEPRRLACA